MLPVVLVNGFLAPRWAMAPLQWRLQRRGLSDVVRARLPPLGIQDVRTLAQALDRSVDQVRERTGAEQVDLVGVSQGGLAALWWLHHGGAAHCRRFVALGTPFHGTWFAAAGVPVLGGVSRGVWQSLPSSALVRELTERGAPDGVAVTSVAMNGDVVAPPSSCNLRGAELILAPVSRNPMRHQALIASAACADITARVLLADDD